MTAAAEVDLAIVGAGPAGLAAAKTARAEGLSVRVLEAKPRIGGRAQTDATTLGVPWDLGAHWLHSADINPFRAVADQLGVAYRREPTPRRVWLGGADGGREGAWADADIAAAIQADFESRFAAIEAAGRSGRDVAAAEVAEGTHRWSSLFAQWLAALTGADPKDCSCLDDSRYRDSGQHWPVRDGYGALIARWAAGEPVELQTPVRLIDTTGPGLRLETPRGTLRARTAIVTASTSALAAGALRFRPGLPADVEAALEAVPLGGANKVALRFDRDVFGLGPGHVVSLPHAPAGMTFQIAPFDRPIAIGHLGGRYAAALEQAGPETMRERALEILAAIFGTAVRRRLTAWQTTAWCGDPWICGGYSVARPGQAHLRPRLADAVGPGLWLAGEACSLAHFGTADGAYRSGVEAARAAVACIRS